MECEYVKIEIFLHNRCHFQPSSKNENVLKLTLFKFFRVYESAIKIVLNYVQYSIILTELDFFLR